ncbi:MAG: nicotinate-nucleotide--dimethylbenzimidazole phosphoribosyltransferase, partial [Bacteroidota bacterium]
MTAPVNFSIPKLNEGILTSLQNKVDHKTKPHKALGKLEDIAIQIGQIQNSLSPKLINPHLLVFAGDHGITNEGVSQYPSEVTPQMVLNFLEDGAAINVFTRQHEIKLQIIDAGVDYTFNYSNERFFDQKIGYGTRNFL